MNIPNIAPSLIVKLSNYNALKINFYILIILGLTIAMPTQATDLKTEEPTSENVESINTTKSESTADAATKETNSSKDVESEVKVDDQKDAAPTNKVDTLTNYNSSCKYNFLFYFIYKIKYDENGNTDGGSLNFEF